MDLNQVLCTEIRGNLDLVQEKIARAAQSSGRDAKDVKLVTVSKKKSVEVIRAAIAAGITMFGENYPEETVEKMGVLNAEFPDLQWHMIGHLQSRKTKLVAQQFDMMHSLDSVKLANKLGRAMEAQKRKLPVLLEMNVSGEATKGGWAAWEESEWEQLLPVVKEILSVEFLNVKGLMAMPPLSVNAEVTRPYFRKLRKLRDWLAKQFPDEDWRELSMGTSLDYEVAVEEGATFVRIGTAILGKRAY